MIKRTLKNVRRLKWFCMAMWVWGGALLLNFAKYAADGWFADKIALGIVLAIGSVLSWVFWFLGFVSYMEIEQEIEDKMKERAIAKRSNQ